MHTGEADASCSSKRPQQGSGCAATGSCLGRERQHGRPRERQQRGGDSSRLQVASGPGEGRPDTSRLVVSILKMVWWPLKLGAATTAVCSPKAIKGRVACSEASKELLNCIRLTEGLQLQAEVSLRGEAPVCRREF